VQGFVLDASALGGRAAATRAASYLIP